MLSRFAETAGTLHPPDGMGAFLFHKQAGDKFCLAD